VLSKDVCFELIEIFNLLKLLVFLNYFYNIIYLKSEENTNNTQLNFEKI